MEHRPCLSGSAHDRAEAIVRRCGGGRAGKAGWMVCCPAHDDHTPSLSVTAREGKVLLQCFAGCDTTAIVQAMALTLRDLFADEDWTPTTPHKKPGTRKRPPTGAADPVALAFAVDLVLDDVEMLTVEGLVAVLKQAAADPVQWLWLEQAFAKAGRTPTVVWQVLFPTTECPYATLSTPRRPSGQPVTLAGRQPSSVQIGENRA